MKRLLIFSMVFGMFCKNDSAQNHVKYTLKKKVEEFNKLSIKDNDDWKDSSTYSLDIEILLQAMIMVESRGNDSCIGDRFLAKPSIGCLQIRPIMVREVNRVLKKMDKEERAR